MQLSAFLGALLSGGSIIDLDGTVFVQLGMFFVAFVVLYALVFKPMVAVLEAREAAIDGAKDEARHLEQEVKDKQASFESRAAQGAQRLRRGARAPACRGAGDRAQAARHRAQRDRASW